MEEREALKRQIELLQDLINKHKSVHGDAPFPAAEQTHLAAPTFTRGRGHSTFAPQTRGSWRGRHSLRNKNPETSLGHQAAVTSSSTGHQSGFQPETRSILLPSHSRGEEEGDETKTAPLLTGIAQQKKEAHVSSTTGIREDASRKPSTDDLHKSLTGTSSQHETQHRQTQGFQQKTETRQAVQEEMAGVSSEASSSVKIKTQVQIKPSLISKPTPVVPTTDDVILLPPAVSEVAKQPSTQLSSQTSQAQVSKSFLKKSKFTWVKSQTAAGVESRQASSVSSSPGKVASVSQASASKASSGSSPSSSKRTPVRKLPRKLSPITIAQRTSKYKWVSSSAGAQAKTSRKPLSPKVLTLPQRALEKGEATKRLRSPSTPSAKVKRATSSTLSSQYRWKAGGQSSPGAATAGPAATARRRSAFHWTAEKSNRGVKGGLVVSPSLPQRASLPSSSPGGFKLRSRMKIIRKSPNSAGGSERGSSPSAAKFSPRGRSHTWTRTPTGVKRTPSRELVSFGRHKLRRLSPTSSRTSPASSSPCGPASQRVFRTRYKMVTRPGPSSAHNHHYNPALSWRAKRIQSARSFLQSRLRSPHDRHPSHAPHWRGSSMCWIGGSLYRVSANKLSRTVASNMSISRTGRFSSPPGSSVSPAWNRPSSTRHLASRAVQRSLAIIRHARQKKQQKQYCMYYNRFGKCNRGTSCPYIHDPDKVAVCTRFLRGTCKQADGTCPFSHKVAKEKMPVCSYFLKGICNNSDCPYSHVYVSRKAEVCEDFVKGYCPEGEKCKKKHTLVCPDFSKTGSCPRGRRCKLQHRQRAKQSTSTTAPPRRGRTKDPTKRPRLSVVMPHTLQAAPVTPTRGPLALPSFISLSSSPEEPDTPDTLPDKTSQVKEKKLQIKPRL
ncbi:zinc finger CCCH domain-containing protein 3 isoform X2 [Hippoglossus stenolepis]|uniref:zinc finger CCCH domain-containing protein 3 isoform X2 n=1 Tax=Hippoglossus stenolepis TaxID=195615 RepID=UPI00159C80E1|nr:zinc finger CCCH domain-containing protein 3 isoform X2 [Hippoglossus stenolepis]